MFPYLVDFWQVGCSFEAGEGKAKLSSLLKHRLLRYFASFSKAVKFQGKCSAEKCQNGEIGHPSMGQTSAPRSCVRCLHRQTQVGVFSTIFLWKVLMATLYYNRIVLHSTQHLAVFPLLLQELRDSCAAGSFTGTVNTGRFPALSAQRIQLQLGHQGCLQLYHSNCSHGENYICVKSHALADLGGAGPLAPKIFSKSCSFQAISSEYLESAPPPRAKVCWPPPDQNPGSAPAT